jgi:2-haloalkanoic acid dehalogenase type II
MQPCFDAVLFDLLTGLLDSWSFWDHITRDPNEGRRWRLRYLELSYGAGEYLPVESLVARAAEDVGLSSDLAREMFEKWDQLEPWPEVPEVLSSLGVCPTGVVTNCSEVLAQRAVERVGVSFSVVVSAERAGAYKPNPEPYRLALSELDLPPDRVLYVAGSPYDVLGASEVGLPVFWHNRAGLVSEATSVARVVADTLNSLRPMVIGGG